jgi:hypothetical protein
MKSDAMLQLSLRFNVVRSFVGLHIDTVYD